MSSMSTDDAVDAWTYPESHAGAHAPRVVAAPLTNSPLISFAPFDAHAVTTLLAQGAVEVGSIAELACAQAIRVMAAVVAYSLLSNFSHTAGGDVDAGRRNVSCGVDLYDDDLF